MMYHHASTAPNAVDTMAAVAAQYWGPMAMASSSSTNSITPINSSISSDNRNRDELGSITKNLNFYGSSSSTATSAAAAAAASFLNYPGNTQDYMKNVIGAAAAVQWATNNDTNTYNITFYYIKDILTNAGVLAY